MPLSPARRRFPRYAIQLPLLYTRATPAPGRIAVGWTRDLSEGGACAELAERLRPQTPLRIRIRTDGGAIEGEAKVTWVGEPGSNDGGVPHGMAFSQISVEQHQALRDLVCRRGVRGHAGVRLPLEIAVICQPKGQRARKPVQGSTGDISRGGILLLLPEILPPGAAVELAMLTINGPLTAEAVIVWVESPGGRAVGPPFRHGLQFTALSWTTTQSLGRLLAEML